MTVVVGHREPSATRTKRQRTRTRPRRRLAASPPDVHNFTNEIPTTEQLDLLTEWPFPTLDTRFFAKALDLCNNDTDCVLARIPRRAKNDSSSCSQPTVLSLHHMMGEKLAFRLKSTLSWSCSGVLVSYNMNPAVDHELLRRGPILNFLRDPLEVVISGYQTHLRANYTWLEEFNIKKRLSEKSLEKGLSLEYREVALRNLDNANKLYQFLAKNSNTQETNHFTVRADQLNEERMFSLTIQAIQVWLGIDTPLPVGKLSACCFVPDIDDTTKSRLRNIVMDKHSQEIYMFRRHLDYSRIGLETWTRQQYQYSNNLLRLPMVVLVGAFSLYLPVYLMAGLSRMVLFIGRRQRHSLITPSGTQSKKSSARFVHKLIIRCSHELSFRTPLFAVKDPYLGRSLHIQETFAPTPIWKTRIIRMGFLLWSLQIFLIDMNLFRFHWFYFAFLSQLTFVLTIGYFGISALVAFSAPFNQPERGARPNLLVCIHWAWFSAITVLQFVVTSCFWATKTNYFLSTMSVTERYPSFMKHGGFFLVTCWEGLVYSRIPLRAKLVLFPWSAISLFSAWTLYQNLLGPPNPFFYGTEQGIEDDDAIYPQFNWKKRPTSSFFNFMAGHFLLPVYFAILWVISASTRCRFDKPSPSFAESQKSH